MWTQQSFGHENCHRTGNRYWKLLLAEKKCAPSLEYSKETQTECLMLGKYFARFAAKKDLAMLLAALLCDTQAGGAA